MSDWIVKKLGRTRDCRLKSAFELDNLLLFTQQIFLYAYWEGQAHAGCWLYKGTQSRHGYLPHGPYWRQTLNKWDTQTNI